MALGTIAVVAGLGWLWSNGRHSSGEDAKAAAIVGRESQPAPAMQSGRGDSGGEEHRPSRDDAVAIRVRSVLYLSEQDATALALNADERARFTRHCAEFAGRVLEEFARAGRLQRVADNDYLMSVRLTQEVAERLEADFLRGLEAQVGSKAVGSLEQHPDVYLRVRFALLNFGAEPVVLQFRGNADTMAASDRIEWTQAWRIGGAMARVTTISGSLSRSGFRAVYGPLAEVIGL
jgi:hypothetical protein